MNFNVNVSDKLICCVCMSILTLPKTLNCGHTLCSDCLQHLYNASMQTNYNLGTGFSLSYSCPTCRIEINLQPDSIAVNMILKKIIDDYFTDNVQKNPSNYEDISILKNDENICASCGKKIDNLSTYTCNTCDNDNEIKFYCANCGWKDHSSHEFNKFDPQALIHNIHFELTELQKNDPLQLINEKVKEQNLNRINNVAKNYQHLLIVVRNIQILVMNKKHITIDLANEVGIILNDINNLMVYNIEKINDIKEKIKKVNLNEEVNHNLKLNFEAIKELKNTFLIYNNMKNEINNIDKDLISTRKRKKI